jgi:hypothetical protein
MDSLVQVKQIGNSFFSFLLIPSIFVCVVYLGKLFDFCLSKPSFFNIESFVGFVFALLIGIKSWYDQNQSTFTIMNLFNVEGKSSYVMLHNLSDKEINANFEIFSKDTKDLFSIKIPKHTLYKVSLYEFNQIRKSDSTRFSLRINANVKGNDLLVEAADISDLGQELKEVKSN